MKLVIDSYAWIEYFDGTNLGLKVKDFFNDKNNTIITNAITITEVVSKAKRAGKDIKEIYEAMSNLSSIYNINDSLALEAGELHADIKSKRKHFSVADIFVLLTARKLNAKVVTGDEDFRGLKEAIMIK
ncbi:MAG: PIN domain-containing protein [Candidatus Nanoarchaeia archaeon]|nr:PIN domain-containing protein [Candidatus Nanoarchaeia archaeon]